MANTVLITLRSLYYPLRRDVVKLAKSHLEQNTRTLYAKATLGLDGFAEHKLQVKNQMANIETKFREKMSAYAKEDSKSMIFTEDLKNMIHLAESDDDVNLVVQMLKKFNSQNKQLRFGNFVFGPVAMRLFYTLNKPDVAIESFKSAELDGIWDQLITYQILLDLLYENGKYQDILALFDTIKDRQLEATKYPRNVVVLVMAACYKMNTQESLQYALRIWKELNEAGHFPMRRATTFCAGLAVNLGNPEAALEILGSVRKPNYVTVRNIKVKALTQVGRLDDAIRILKSVLSEDQPDTATLQTFNREVLEMVKGALLKVDDPDLSLEYNRLEKLFEKQGNISNKTLDELLCLEIQPPPIMNNRQQNRFSRYNEFNGPRRDSRANFRRPGLSDMV